MTTKDFDGFERLARPLLVLIQQLSGLETSFVTRIDWLTQKQEVVLALNTSDLEVAEGSVVDWSESMCRLAFLTNNEYSSDVRTDFPGSLGAEGLGMQTFFALPILDGDLTLGTVCGASRRQVPLTPDVVGNVRLITESMSFQMASYAEGEALRRRVERAEALALVDHLTGLANRRGFTSRFEEESARVAHHGSTLSVLVIDVDHFKSVNDTYGHPGGDTVLVTVADVLRDAARTADVPARLGGDEFALLLPYCDVAGAEAVASRIAHKFCEASARLNMPCTLSIGISTSETSSLISLLATADKALYRSKASGRDRIEAWALSP